MRRGKRIPLAAAIMAALGLATVLQVPAATAATTDAGPASAGALGGLFPNTIALPDDFQPEGIAIGPGPFAYFGSRLNAAIYRANLVTGQGRLINAGLGPNTQSLGMKTDRQGRLFVAGGATGQGRVVDTRTGTILVTYQFATGTTFVNDVILTRDAAWFTDSRLPVLYKVPLGRRGRLPAPDGFVAVPLTGEIQVVPGATNANGIVRTPDGRGLIIVQSNTGLLYRVDPGTGATTKVDLGTESVPNGDGLLLIDRTLYVVQNRLNQVAVIQLNRAGTAGTLQRRVTDPSLDVPTTVAAFGRRLYLPNARFGTTDPPPVKYNAVAIRRP